MKAFPDTSKTEHERQVGIFGWLFGGRSPHFAEGLVLLLLAIVLAQMLFADDAGDIILILIVFSLSTLIGAYLIHSVRHEAALRKETQELDRLKSEFIYLATHQIRSPLTAIRGYLSMVLRGDYGDVPDEIEKPLRASFHSTADMVDTVEYFLDITRIERGTMHYDKDVFDMKQLTQEAAEQTQAMVSEAGLTFHVDIDEDQQYFVYGDYSKIKQVVINLIENAVYYTSQGSVTIHLWRYDHTVRIEVADTGFGLSPEDQEKIFTKFGRVAGSEKQNVFGAGLGLYIGRQVIGDHHGVLGVDSDGRGKGSTFYIELPEVREH